MAEIAALAHQKEVGIPVLQLVPARLDPQQLEEADAVVSVRPQALVAKVSELLHQ